MGWRQKRMTWRHLGLADGERAGEELAGEESRPARAEVIPLLDTAGAHFEPSLK